MPSRLTVTSLNVGRLLEEKTRNFLERMSSGDERGPDVLCLQDMPLSALGLLKKVPYVHFTPMTNSLVNDVRMPVGVVIASRYFMSNVTCCPVWGDGTFKDLEGANGAGERYLGEESDRMIAKTEDRVVVCATITKNGNGFNIATTHGYWTRRGSVNDAQREATKRTCYALNNESEHRGGLVLIGDLNCNRGNEIYHMFLGTLVDCVPTSIDNTLDPEHPAVKEGLKIVTDYVMTTPLAPYAIDQVVVRDGVSDHCAISARITAN